MAKVYILYLSLITQNSLFNSECSHCWSLWGLNYANYW